MMDEGVGQHEVTANILDLMGIGAEYRASRCCALLGSRRHARKCRMARRSGSEVRGILIALALFPRSWK